MTDNSAHLDKVNRKLMRKLGRPADSLDGCDYGNGPGTGVLSYMIEEAGSTLA